MTQPSPQTGRGRPESGAGVSRASVSRAAGSTHAKLMLLLPLLAALLVSGTGLFTLRMARRAYASDNAQHEMAQTGVKVALMTAAAGLLGYLLARGVLQPLREVTGKLGAVAEGDLRPALHIRSSAELDTLGSAFNEAVDALNRYVRESMAGAVVTLNTQGRVIGSSPAAEAILGFREEEIVGKRFSEVFAPSREGRASLAAIEEGIARRERLSKSDAVIATRDGRQLTIGLNVSYLRSPAAAKSAGRGEESEDVVGVTIAFKDTTEVRHLREHIQRADQLVALGTLTAGVAHELRNPLASIQGLVELLVSDFGPEDPRQTYATQMLTAIDRLNGLVEELLVFSSPAPSLDEHIGVRQLVEDTVEFMQLGLDRPVNVSLTCDESLDRAAVAGHAERLARVFTNILQNAVQATPDGGHVVVRATSDRGRARIAVTNSGSYIPPDLRKQLFVPFFTTRPRGTGLGLAIARQIVVAHGGQIDVDSDEQTGTTFAIELPLAGVPGGEPATVHEMQVAHV